MLRVIIREGKAAMNASMRPVLAYHRKMNFPTQEPSGIKMVNWPLT